MDPITLMNSHRSIRSYRSDPIPQADLDKILHAATRASSSGNMQTYSIVVTKDAGSRAKLWEFHFRQDMVKQAPLLLTFCADWNRMKRWCHANDADPGYDNYLSFMVGFADAVIAAQNAVLAAESLGYGICYMGTTLCAVEGIIEHLKLPPGVYPATTLVVGVPDEDPELRARLPIEGIVHEEIYRDFDAERIASVYKERETEGWKRYMTFPDLAKQMRESGVKNLAQVYTTLKYTRESNDRISHNLLNWLERQGFMEQGSGD
jgi:nitroreductase